MTDDRRPKWNPFDEAKMLLVREFLRREFRDWDHRDFVVFDPPAQTFILTKRGVDHTLVIPKATFEVTDFGALCNAELTETLTRAREGRVTLTPDGPDVRG